MTVEVEGATHFRGAETGRDYRIPAGETRTLEGPAGEFATVPSGRLVEPVRSYETGGSWKTLYEDGEEVATVQCFTEEAEAWQAGDLSLDEIQN
jgi:hypothetical protein